MDDHRFYRSTIKKRYCFRLEGIFLYKIIKIFDKVEFKVLKLLKEFEIIMVLN